MKQKKRGIASTSGVHPVFASGFPKVRIRVSAAWDVKLRLLMFSREKKGRSKARECFQVAPSLEKMEVPSRGRKTARRVCGWVMLDGWGLWGSMLGRVAYGAGFEVLEL